MIVKTPTVPCNKKANAYGLLRHEGILCNPDEQRAEDVQTQAWHVIEAYVQQAQADDLAQAPTQLQPDAPETTSAKSCAARRPSARLLRYPTGIRPS